MPVLLGLAEEPLMGGGGGGNNTVCQDLLLGVVLMGNLYSCSAEGPLLFGDTLMSRS